jgi:hypothetical protein
MHSPKFTIHFDNMIVVNRILMKDIFKTLISSPTNKRGSRSYERVFAICFIKKNIKTHNYKNKWECCVFIKIYSRWQLEKLEN